MTIPAPGGAAEPKANPPNATPFEKGPKRTEDIGKELRDKVRSKFQVSTFLAGFAFTILNGQVAILRRPEEIMLLPLSTAILVFAIIIFASSVMLLDGLMMPKVFWRRGRTASGCNYGPCTPMGDFDPPYTSPKDLWRIKGTMQFYWTFMTLLATALTLLSLILAIVPLQLNTIVTIPAEIIDGYQSPSVASNLSQTLYLVQYSASFAVTYVFVLRVLASLLFGPQRWD